MHFHVIVVIRQAFAKALHAQAPFARALERVFEIRAKTDAVEAAGPAFAAAAALIAIAADKILVFFIHVAETGNVKTVGTIAERHFVFVAGHDDTSAAAHVVVHEIVAEFAAGIGETVREFGSRGIEKDAPGLQSRGAKEKEARLEFEPGF